MTADRHHLRFYVDESALGLGKALEAARKDTIHAGHKLIPECPLGSLDPDWIPAVAARDLVVIARDRRIRTRPQELERFRVGGLRVFWVAGKKDLSTWDWLVRLARHWETLERTIRIEDQGRGSMPSTTADCPRSESEVCDMGWDIDLNAIDFEALAARLAGASSSARRLLGEVGARAPPGALLLAPLRPHERPAAA